MKVISMQCISDFQIDDQFCSKDYITYAKVNTFFLLVRKGQHLGKQRDMENAGWK